MFFALDDADSVQRNRGNDSTLAAADGAIAASGIDDAVWKIQLQYHIAAMARSPMLWLNNNAVNFLEH